MREIIPVPKANSFSVMYKGEILKGDDTFLKRLVPQGSQFILWKGGAA
jgi:hypothetical protein